MHLPTFSNDSEAGAGCSSVLSLCVAGTPVRVTGLKGVLRQHFAALVQGFITPDDPTQQECLWLDLRRRSEDERWVTACNGMDVAEFADVETALTQLEWQVVARSLQANAASAVFHAAALTRDSSTIIVVAESGSGKTTISLELLRRNWLPYGDDVALIDTDSLALQNFQRCFHTDTPEVQGRVVAPWAEPIASIPGYSRPLRWAPAGKSPTAIVLMARDSTQPSSLVPITRAEAAGGLLGAAIRSALPRRAVAGVAARVAASATVCCRLNNGELERTLSLLESL